MDGFPEICEMFKNSYFKEHFPNVYFCGFP